MASKGMWRMIGRQVRSRRDRSIALGAGILVASVSFSLLTAAASTSQLEVHGTVDAAARPAYDILVRPKGAADAIETQDNLVRDNYLAGTFGGISIAQWQKILNLPNVTVAAPIANIGYVIPAGDRCCASRAAQQFGRSAALPRQRDLEGRQRPLVISRRHVLRVLQPDRPADDPEVPYGGDSSYDTLVKEVPGSAEPIPACPNVYGSAGGLNTGAAGEHRLLFGRDPGG